MITFGFDANKSVLPPNRFNQNLVALKKRFYLQLNTFGVQKISHMFAA